MAKLNFPASEIANKDDVKEAVEQLMPKVLPACSEWYDQILVIKDIQRDENGKLSYKYSTFAIDQQHEGTSGGLEEPDCIPIRNYNACLTTNYPSDKYDCTNKSYVDGLVGDVVEEAMEEINHTKIPIPSYQEESGIEKVVVYDDSDNYLEDENYNRYINPSAFKPRPIDDGKGYSNETHLNGSKEDTANRAGYIAARDSKGNLWTGTPIDDVDCVPYSMYKELLDRIVALESKI